MFLSRIAPREKNSESSENAVATPRRTLTGRATHVSDTFVSSASNILTILAGTARYYELHGLEKPEGYENQQD